MRSGWSAPRATDECLTGLGRRMQGLPWPSGPPAASPSLEATARSGPGCSVIPDRIGVPYRHGLYRRFRVRL